MGKEKEVGSETGANEPHAAGDMVPLVYDELRRLAANERPGQTLQATALVHEAWMPLFRIPIAETPDR